MTPVRFGILGCAAIAGRRMLPAMRQVAEAVPVAVASRDLARAEEFAGRFGIEAVEGYERLLARDDIDAVYIPLPTALHAEWIGRALAAGKHVLAEKPLATTAAQAAALSAQARRAGLHLAENFMFLHHPQHALVSELLADGVIGEPRSFTAEFRVPPFAPDDIRYRPGLGGGALLDLGVYPLRAAQLHLGDALRVVGSVLRHDAEHDVDTGGAALLATPEGVTAQLSFGMADAYRSRYEVVGSRGRIRLDRAFTPPEDRPAVVLIEHGDGTTTERTVAPAVQFALSVRSFAEAVRQGGAVPDPAIVRQARLLDDIRDRARAGTGADLRLPEGTY
ncbi:Gfo/Idh/MocA family oxidoreductase [Streptomyces sp. SID8379]|uniref:Gfo/Idh/MocA family protein n=1 Tax=unclassified Streptomyces TaxID=2593676 RepID=UPI000362BFEB|nr:MULTISPECIES: Gfo/Idh/MocA family oxidoreductase [unclassified Streptomyces]MYW65858.1 Gfo/Idh/MocA family oxidoreductase [Streptomyces sp. SID8379]